MTSEPSRSNLSTWRRFAHDLLGSEELARNGRSARTLAKGKGMTAVLTAVRAGGEIHEHAAPGPVVIVPVTGAVTVEGLKNRQSLTLGSGRPLFIGQGEKHRVSAAEDAAFLLLIGLQS